MGRRRQPAQSGIGWSLIRRWSCGPSTVPQRAQRRQEDRVWQDLWMAHRTSPDRRRRSVTARAAAAAWRAQRVERQEVLAQRRQEDARWQQQRQALYDTPSPAPAARRWIAVLVLTDNCTRQCLGLPLFEAGPQVTAEMVRCALETLLPPELRFLISDRGSLSWLPWSSVQRIITFRCTDGHGSQDRG